MLIVGNWNAGLNRVEGALAGHVCKNVQGTNCADPYRTSDFYILAPGAGVTGAGITTETRTMSGTSQASAVVAGAAAVVTQLWPYMESDKVVQLLLKTANKNLPNYSADTHGQGLLDLDRATQPVGSLGISTSGRLGQRQAIAGALQVGTKSLPSDSTMTVSSVDDMGRDFKVNIASLVASRPIDMIESFGNHDQSWTSRLAGLYPMQVGNTAFATNGQDTSVSVRIPGSKNVTHQATVTTMRYNPWVNFNGMWGSMRGATNMEYSLRYNQEDWYLRGGMISTLSDYQSGLVSRVDPILSAYAGLGVSRDNASLEMGIKPTVIAGAVKLRLPGDVDNQGNMSYNNVSMSVRDQMQGYLAANWNGNIDRTSMLNLGAQVDSQGKTIGYVRYQQIF